MTTVKWAEHLTQIKPRAYRANLVVLCLHTSTSVFRDGAAYQK